MIGLLVMGEIGEEMKPLMGRMGSVVWRDRDVVKRDHDVRATDISSGEKENGCSSSPSRRKKMEDNTVMGKKKRLTFSMRIPSLPI